MVGSIGWLKADASRREAGKKPFRHGNYHWHCPSPDQISVPVCYATWSQNSSRLGSPAFNCLLITSNRPAFFSRRSYVLIPSAKRQGLPHSKMNRRSFQTCQTTTQKSAREEQETWKLPAKVLSNPGRTPVYVCLVPNYCSKLTTICTWDDRAWLLCPLGQID